MVEFIDGSILAQLGSQDMRLAIQYALLSQPGSGYCDKIDLAEQEPSRLRARLTRFPLFVSVMRLFWREYSSLRSESANEETVGLFMSGRIGFYGYCQLVEDAMLSHDGGGSLDQVLAADPGPSTSSASRKDREMILCLVRLIIVIAFAFVFLRLLSHSLGISLCAGGAVRISLVRPEYSAFARETDTP